MVSFGIGQAVRRVEDRRFLTGRGSYVDDMELPRQCYGVAVLSTHAHARIKRIDVAAARAAPGVALVLTGADAARGEDRRHPAPLHAGTLGRPQRLRHHATGAAGGSRALRRRSRRLRRRRDRGAGARRRRAGRGRVRAVAGRDQPGGRRQAQCAEDLGRLPERQHRRDHRVRRQGGDRCRLRQGQACRFAAAREQSRHRQRDRAALRDRRRTAAVVTRSTRRRRIRTGSAASSRRQFSTFPKRRSASCRQTSAAASA